LENTPVAGLTLFFEAGEQEAAELIGGACAQSVDLIQQLWGLGAPEDCRVYVMTSWLHFMFHAAPWPWRPLLAIFFPLWAPRAKKLWRYAGGWAQRYGNRRAVGVKPPHLAQLSDRSIGGQVFVKEDDVREKVRHVTCHELVHAFASHLRLPMWLNEGLAMVTVDRYFQKQTVRRETLGVLERWSRGTGPGRYRKLRVEDKDAMVYHCVRGYWLTRYIEDTQPELLRGLLARRTGHRELERKVASAYGQEVRVFWQHIDRVVSSYFT
jgi:hypothetical protein